jgi:rhodanese-related sulfurtransferase
MSLPEVPAADAKRLIEKGAVLVDIPDDSEYRRERIPGSSNLPLGRLCEGDAGLDTATVVFHCRSGARTRMNAPLLRQAARGEAFVMEGGIEAWKLAGYPVVKGDGEPSWDVSLGGLVEGLKRALTGRRRP